MDLAVPPDQAVPTDLAPPPDQSIPLDMAPDMSMPRDLGMPGDGPNMQLPDFSGMLDFAGSDFSMVPPPDMSGGMVPGKG